MILDSLRPLALVFSATWVAVPAVAQTNPVPAYAPAASPIAPTVSLAEGYVLGPGDVIEVSVVGRDEYRGRVQVQTDGTIDLPYIKTVRAAGKTVLDLRNTVRTMLNQGGFYIDPAVSVIVTTYASRHVTVLGEVGTPGLLPVDKAYRLSEILAKVGGARGTGDDQVVLTHADGRQERLSVGRVASGGLADDPFVNPDDKIYIAPSATFYIYGQVNAAGSYKLEPGMTLRMVLARGGGLTDRGSDRKIKVFRDGKEVDHIDLSMPIEGRDTVVVGERFF